MNAEIIAIVTVGVALTLLLIRLFDKLRKDMTHLRMELRYSLEQQAALKQSCVRRCAHCSVLLPRNRRGPTARFCLKCRKREQNRRAYQRRKAKAALRDDRPVIA